jgi:hypothetical protein
MTKAVLMVNTEKLISDFDELLAECPVMLTGSQSANLLNISRTSIWRLCESGDLERVRFKMMGEKQASVRIPADSVRKLFVSWLENAS